MPTGKKPAALAKKDGADATSDEAAIPLQISPDKIRKNPKNPRLSFPQPTIERLAESIEEVGVLVPVTVYKDEPQGGTEYVLLDGERRWRAAKQINLPSIPAWVIPKPDDAENALRMFNIHMLREDWSEIATAWALEAVMKETGITDDKELKHVTGLTIDRIRNIKRVLAFPEKWQQAVEEERVPFNLLVELDKAVLSRADEVKSTLHVDVTREKLRDVFLQKYEKGVFDDVVDLRKVGALVETAQQEGKVGERARRAFKRLVTDAGTSIDDAYEEGAAASVGIGRIIRDLDALPGRIDDLMASKLHDDALGQLTRALVNLRKELDRLLAGLKK